MCYYTYVYSFFCRLLLLLYRKSTEQNIQVSILARGGYLSALSNSDVLRCLVGLHMAWLDLLRSMHSIHIVADARLKGP